jgi:elongation factor Ts
MASDADAIALVEVNAETDFVTKGEEFQGLAAVAVKLALAHKPADLNALLALKDGSETLEEKRRALIAKLGENMTIRRFEVVSKAAGAIAHYLHGTKIGVVVALNAGEAELAKDIAMHVAASNPRYLDATSFSAEVLASERKIIEATVAKEQEEARLDAEEAGKPFKAKPAEILAKMIDGKIGKFVAENTLLGQPFVKNPDETVEKLLKSKNASVARYVRFAVGEGIEKVQTDFAAEVAAASAAASKV